MKKKMVLSQFLTVSFALCSASAFAQFSLLENALPADENTKIVRLVDEFNPNIASIPLLLTNGTGYEIRCNSPSGLGAIFDGLGFDVNLVPFMETVTQDDPRVVDSNYQSNPVLNCERSANHKLYVVEYPEGSPEAAEYIDGLRYFIHFGESNALNMIGCQGLIDALGYSLEDAEPMSYDIAHSFFVDVGDEHDIHCIDGEVAGPKHCGEHDNGSTWLEPIDNGNQGYFCNEGVAEKDGDPVCDENYAPNGGQCVYVYRACGSHSHGAIWTGNIPNGTQDYSCQDGNIVLAGAPACNPGYEASGEQCIYVPKNCGSYTHGATWNQAITGGTQTWRCDDGNNVFQSVACSANYTANGQICQYVPKSCGSNAHGSTWTVGITGGTQTWRCDDGDNVFQSVACSANYTANGQTCQYVPKSCGSNAHGSQWSVGITGGTQTWTCNDGSNQFVRVSCSANYAPNGQTCQYVPKSCGSNAHGSQWSVGITGGTQTWRCNDGSTNFVSVSCNANYTRNGQTCRYIPRNCGSRPHNSTWIETYFDSGSQWCHPPKYRDNYRCNDGSTVLVNRETLIRGTPKVPGRACKQ